MLPVLIALFGCGGAVAPQPEASAPPVAEAPPAPPALLVFVVVDQLPQRLLDRLTPAFTGGLARLTGPDAFRAKAAYAHAATNTCPGHATISTGAAPAVHGIVSNAWVREDQEVYCGDLALLKAEPLADRVVASGGTVVAIAHKDRGAIMLGGRSATTVWYDKKAGTFTGAEWAALDLAPMRAVPWEPAHPELYAAHAPDDQPQEGSPDGRTTFPHEVDHPGAFLYSAAAGTALVDAALAGIAAERLGADATPDLLALSFSNTDYVGHAYTTESWEAMDALMGVDRDLGRLFEHLDATVGEGRWTAVLTSDHGVAPIDARRIDPAPIFAAANQALAELGHDVQVLDAEPYLVLPTAIPADRRDEAARAVAAAVAAVDGVAAAYAWRQDGIPDDAPFADAIRSSLHPEHSGDVYLLLDENTLLAYGGRATGTNHGTPYGYDQRVPLLLVGRGVAPGTLEAEVEMRRVAPTVAAILGVSPPSGATEPPLDRALDRGK